MARSKQSRKLKALFTPVYVCMYIYIYMCVCDCVFVCVIVYLCVCACVCHVMGECGAGNCVPPESVFSGISISDRSFLLPPPLPPGSEPSLP